MTESTSASPALGRAITLRRVQMGLKRKDLAARAQLSYPYVSELENGQKEPSTKALRQLAEALQLSVADLMALGEQYASNESAQIELPPFDASLSEPERPVELARALTTRIVATDTRRSLTEEMRSAVLATVDEACREAIERYERTELPALVSRLVHEELLRNSPPDEPR